MIRRRLPALSLAGLILASPGSSRGASPPEDPHPLVAVYSHSPLEAHRALKEAFRQSEAVREGIEAIEAATGDHSFEALKVPTSARVSALYLQSEARRRWEAESKDEALLLYDEARRLLERDGGLTEAAFCRYLQARILAEDERFQESLRLLNEALDRIEGRRYLYLEALLHQSRGFALRNLDELTRSVAAFYRALEIWTRISFNDGEVSSWNNLATLYQALDLPHHAGDSYLEALSRITRRTSPEIRYPLLLNVAIFLKNEGDMDRGLRFLELARPESGLAPAAFALAEAELLETPEPILNLAPREVSVEVSRQILLGGKKERRGDTRGALEHLRTAVELSRASGQWLLARRAALALGRLLEQKGRFEEAGRLYREALNREELVYNIDASFPFRRAVSPLFDGWIRCLVRRGRADEARTAIRGRTLLRLRKIEALLGAGALVPRPGDGLDELASMISLTEARVPVDAGPLETRFPMGDPARPSHENQPWVLTPDTTMVEFWPDRKFLFVWIENDRGSHFLALPGGEDLLRLVRTVSEPLYSASQALPPSPAPEAIRELSAKVLHPLEPWLEGKRILLIPYKEFQALPFELLTHRDGRRLGDRHVTSYLPAPHSRFAWGMGVDDPPLLLTSRELLTREEARRERRYFESLQPPPRVIESPSRLPPVLRGRWVHVAAHLRLNARFWLFSSLGDRYDRVTLGELMNRKLETELLSLAVCDGANSYSEGFPYGFGTAEVFLLQGAQSLILSRWALDERSSVLFVDLYRELARGRPIDEALFHARRNFLRSAGKGSEPTDHPFFWAGIFYAGPPGKTLASGVRGPRGAYGAAAISALTFLLVGGALIRGVRSEERGARIRVSPWR
jgi:tetratricopeptide (TPR) repeat protein